MPEVKIDKERCKGCELCIMYCPKKSLRMSAGFNDKGYHYPEFCEADECTGCALCGRICPEVALEIYK
jgi:2-oxoglutarate ferredoxin oxidoreductase subunit delta